jgi:adenylate kinase
MATLSAPSSSDSAANHPDKKVFILVGPPGCGKGTQAAKLAAVLRIPAISTGEMIRAEIKAGTELGKIAQGVTITGGLLSDDIINKLVESRLQKPDCVKGFLLDGYPRSVGQAEFLALLLPRIGFPQPAVLHIDVPLEQLISRTCLRRYCPDCGEIYNLGSKPPKCGDLCDVDGVELKQRADDCEETVRFRLTAYQKTTAPLLTFYAGPRYYRIGGDQLPEAVFEQILNTIPTAFPQT